MATGPGKEEQWQKVREQIVCAICLDLLRDPKTLPCLHTYCKICLNNSVTIARDKKVIVCPTCRKSVTLTDNGVGGLPTNFTIANLVEVVDLQEQATKSEDVKCGSCSEVSGSKISAFCYNCKEFLCLDCTKSHQKMKTLQHHNCVSVEDLNTFKSLAHVTKPQFCSNHPEKKLKLFCLTCHVLICKDCALVEHRDHQYNFINNVCETERKALSAALKSLEVNSHAITEKITVASKERKKIQNQSELDICKLKHSVEEAIAMLTARKESLEAEVNRNAQVAIDPVQFYEGSLTDMERQMKDCLKFGMDLVQQPSDHNLLALKQQVMLRIEELNNEYEENLQHQSILKPLLEIKKITLPDVDTVKRFCLSFGELRVLDSLNNCQIGGQGILRAYKSKEAHFTVMLKNSEDKKVIVPPSYIVIHLICLTSNNVIDCQITNMSDGSYDISYTPVNIGKHQISITVEGIPFPGSPFDIDVLQPYASIGLKCREVKEYGDGQRFGELWGVTINSVGDIAMSDTTNKCIIVLNRAYQLKHVISGDGKAGSELKYPLGVAYTNDNTLLVVDGYQSKVQEFSAEGEHMSEFGGSRGSEDGQFFKPSGIAIDKRNVVYVVDKGNHRIQAFTKGVFQFKFGSKGSGKGQFEEPYDIAIDNSAEQIFVTDRKLNRVQAFNLHGNFITFYPNHEDHVALKCPNCITMDTDSFVLLTGCPSEKAHCVSIFSPQLGQFVTSFGSKSDGNCQLNWPFGIAVAKNGDIIVVEYQGRRVQIFEL